MDKVTYENDLQDFSFTFIELPKFKKTKISELSNIIDKWCFFFKYADETSESDLEEIIGSDLVMKRAYEALNQFNWSEAELNTYEKEIKRIMDNRAAEDYLIDKGREEGKIETATNMLKLQLDIDIITQVTGLTREEILKIKGTI